jgi:hypothetical protein
MKKKTLRVVPLLALPILLLPALVRGQRETQNLAPIPEKRPTANVIGTPKNIPPGTRMRKPDGKPRPPFLAPRGAINLALKKPVTSSEKEPTIGVIDQVTDGDKQGADGSYVELGAGLQWVQIDLQQPAKIYAVIVWHSHKEPKVYRDVILQVSDDPSFRKDVKTLFNNDADNSAKMGVGDDYEEFEVHEGHLIDARGVAARYVRLYSNGNTDDDMNHYTEVEVYGLPVK